MGGNGLSGGAMDGPVVSPWMVTLTLLALGRRAPLNRDVNTMSTSGTDSTAAQSKAKRLRSGSR